MSKFDVNALVDDLEIYRPDDYFDLDTGRIFIEQLRTGIRVLSITELESICQALGTDPNEYIVDE